MKKEMIIGLISGVVLIIVLGGLFFFNQNKPNQNVNTINPEDATEYVGEDTTIIHKDFRGIMKKDWQEFEVLPFYVYIPPGVSEKDINAESISITAQSLGENNNATLESVLEEGIEQSKKVMPDFELTEESPYKTKFLEGKKIVFTGTHEGVIRKNTQFFGIKYNFIYSVTYSCPIDNCNSYAVFNSLVESFEPVSSERR